MYYIPIILGSVRRGRQSSRPAKFILNRLRQTGVVETDILDLLEYNFPIMEERLRLRDDPPPGLTEFAGKIARADGVVIVTPEYNSGYPGVLKNCLDYLLPELKRKPVGIISVSGGPFGGLSALVQLRVVLMAMGAMPIPTRFPVVKVQDSFTEEGEPTDAIYEKSAAVFIEELLWLVKSVSAGKN
jgi:NAD(P)H-dependent FMN reductase